MLLAANHVRSSSSRIIIPALPCAVFLMQPSCQEIAVPLFMSVNVAQCTECRHAVLRVQGILGPARASQGHSDNAPRFSSGGLLLGLYLQT